MNKKEILADIEQLWVLADTLSTSLTTLSAEIEKHDFDEGNGLADDILGLLQTHGVSIDQPIKLEPKTPSVDEDVAEDKPKKKRARKTKAKKVTEVIAPTIEDYTTSTLDDMISKARDINTRYGTEGAEALTSSVSHLGAERIVEITLDQVPEVMVAFDSVLSDLETKYPVGK